MPLFQKIQRSWKFLISLQLWAMFTVCLVASFYFKQLYRDGAYWAFDLLNQSTLVVDEPFLRYSSFILQAPAFLMSLFNRFDFLTIWLYCVGYFIYPFIALAIIYRLLKKSGKSDAIYLFVASFFLIIVPTWAFSNSVVCEAIVIFWFFYTYVLCSDKPRIRMILLFSVLLLFSYEVGLLFNFLILYILWSEKKLRAPHAAVLIGCAILQVLNLFLRIFPDDSHGYFMASVPVAIQSPFWGLLGLIILVMMIFSFRPSRFRKTILLILAVAIVGVTSMILSLPVRDFWMHSYANRTLAIPSCCILFFFGYWYFKRNDDQLGTGEMVLLSLSFMAPLYLEIALSLDSTRIQKKLSMVMESRPGCHALSPQDRFDIAGDSHLPTWDLSYLTLILNRSRDIKTIYFSKTGVSGPCKVSSDGTEILIGDDFDFELPNSERFNYQKLTEGLEKVSD